MTTASEKNKLLADWLYEKYREVEGQRKRRMSITEFAIYVGVSQASMSQYMNQARLPDHKNADKIASSLGPEIYNILEIPPRLPDDPDLNKLVNIDCVKM